MHEQSPHPDSAEPVADAQDYQAHQKCRSSDRIVDDSHFCTPGCWSLTLGVEVPLQRLGGAVVDLAGTKPQVDPRILQIQSCMLPFAVLQRQPSTASNQLCFPCQLLSDHEAAMLVCTDRAYQTVDGL